MCPDDLKFGVGHPDKIDDWAYRAVHVMTENAKLIVRDYYGRLPQYSYFTAARREDSRRSRRRSDFQPTMTESSRATRDTTGSISWRERCGLSQPPVR